MLYTALPSASACAEWGLVPADFESDRRIELWPENERAFTFFASIGGGAWNIGPGGPVGIRPEAFREIRLALGVTGLEWREMFIDVMAMESEALATMREQTEQARQ